MPESSHASDSAGRLFFDCPACGLHLSVERSLAGVSGPCPTCGSLVVAPREVGRPVAILPMESAKAVIAPAAIRSQPNASRRRKGRIGADSMVDHAHLDRREAARTLLVITLFVLVFCVLVVVTWFLSDRMAE